MVSQSPKKVNIFEYDNFRSYLKDSFEALKREDKKYSYRFFARLAGFKAHSFVKLVMEGQSDLSEDSIEKFAKALKLNKEEKFFFGNLVLLNQSKTAPEKQKYAQEVLRSRTYKKLHPLVESQFTFYSKWYYSPIRELPCLPDFQEDPEWIAKKLNPNITPGEAKKAIEILLTLGLLTRDAQGTLVQSTPHITSTDEVSTSYVVNFHKEFIKRAHDALDLIPLENREVSSVTFGISRETAKKIKEMIKEFRKELVAVASKDGVAETVYQLNLQLFPLIHEKEDPKS
jgi:uncharacterized protein (TIGR02147 family)